MEFWGRLALITRETASFLGTGERLSRTYILVRCYQDQAAGGEYRTDGTNKTDGTDAKDRCDLELDWRVAVSILGCVSEGFIPPHGGYEELLSFKKSRIVYDATVFFCERYVDKYSRTVDQMVQAARSGKQNIIEGSRASGTSRETEIKLTNVARASLEELLEDYRDYLRVRGHELWDKNSKQALYVRKIGRDENESYESYRPYFETRPPETVANIIICLIHQTNYLLDQQIKRLEQDFLKHGGLKENMYKARLARRDKQRRGED